MVAEAHVGVHAGEEFAIGIGDVDFYQHGAGDGVERIRRACHVAHELAAGIFDDGDFGDHAGVDTGGVGLGHVFHDADGGDLGNAIHLTAGGGCSLPAPVGGDEGTGFHVAGGDDAGEGRAHLLIILQGEHTIEVGLRLADILFGGAHVGVLGGDHGF